MLPASYATATAVILAVGGALSCFAGYRLFRLILGLYGFVIGAMVTTSMVGASNTWTMVLAAVVGGIVGAVLMVAAYFLGVGLVGALLAAIALNGVWRFVGGDPPTWLLVVCCVARRARRAVGARYVVIFGTAIAGSLDADYGRHGPARRSEGHDRRFRRRRLGPLSSQSSSRRVVGHATLVRSLARRHHRPDGDDDQDRS